MASDPTKDMPAHSRDENSVPSTPAARALAEATERRHRAAATAAKVVPEVGGRDGLDPVRYGDWEVNGIASDF